MNYLLFCSQASSPISSLSELSSAMISSRVLSFPFSLPDIRAAASMEIVSVASFSAILKVFWLLSFSLDEPSSLRLLQSLF